MSFLVNALIILVIFGVGLLALYFFFKSRKKVIDDHIMAEDIDGILKYSEDALLEHIKEKINEYTRMSLHDLGLTELEYEKEKNKRTKLKNALKQCTYGSIQDKELIKERIYNLLNDHISDDGINTAINFNSVNKLTYQDKFDILLYLYKEKYEHKYDALTFLITKYKLDVEKQLIENGDTISFLITKDEIDKIFYEEYTEVSLTFRDKLRIITQRVYQRYKGLGVIDEIRDMNIDGVSGGVSGRIDVSGHSKHFDDYIDEINRIPLSCDSVWIFFKGKSINLAFLSFQTDNELKRICQNIYRYNKVGQLSERVGFRVNEMKDGSRIVVVRPPFSESWAFFVRKFHMEDVKLEDLIKDENCKLPIEMIKNLTKGARVMALTGAQGTGKTTMLMAMIKSIYATLPLRVQEMAFELHLRNIYPNRNILTFRETETITGQMGLDLQKKTDGSVNILGEVATDPVAAWMIQMAQVASLFVIFSHHAKKAKDLVLSIRNSLLKCEVFNDEKTAEEQVASVLNFDIHLVKDRSGKRYVERITEIVLVESEEYSMDFKQAETEVEAAREFYTTATEFFKRMTDRKIFTTRNIIEFDRQSKKYVVTNKITQKNIDEMIDNMTMEDADEFKQFIKENWGD